MSSTICFVDNHFMTLWIMLLEVYHYIQNNNNESNLLHMLLQYHIISFHIIAEYVLYCTYL